MSKINAIRIINLHYNHDLNQIDDLMIEANGENTLINLTNGGGKSTLIQLITALFVHKRYRNVNQGGKDRPFGDFFTVNHRPSFLMVEWLRDDGVSKVMTGSMVYRMPGSINEGESLKMWNFIGEYRDGAEYDIRHIPVIETKKQRQPITYQKGKDLFNKYRDRHKMFVYDMNENRQARKYFEKLDENKIPPKEWESIIHKINEDESGVVKMFSDCTTAPDLLKKVLLPAVEDKLNTETSHMTKFQEMTEAYITQCFQNASKIEENNQAQSFENDLSKMQDKGHDLYEKWRQEQDDYHTILGFKEALNNASVDQNKAVLKQSDEIDDLHQQQDDLDFEEKSYELITASKALLAQNDALTKVQTEEVETTRKREETNDQIHIQETAQAYARVAEAKTALEKIQYEMDYAKKDRAPLEKEHDGLGYHLQTYYQGASAQIKQQLTNAQSERAQTKEKQQKVKEDLRQSQKALAQVESRIASLTSRQKDYDHREARFNKRYDKHYTRLLNGLYEEGFLESEKADFQARMTKHQSRQEEMRVALVKTKSKQEHLTKRKESNAQEMTKVMIDLHVAKQRQEALDLQKQERLKMLRYVDLGSEDVYDREKINQALVLKMNEKSQEIALCSLDIHNIDSRISRLETGQNVVLPDALKKLLEDHGIHYEYGGQWLKMATSSEKVRHKLIEAHPFLPYAIVISAQDLSMLKDMMQNGADLYSEEPIPFITYEALQSRKKADQDIFYTLQETSFYMLFDEKLLIAEELGKVMASLTAKRARYEDKQKTMNNELEHFQAMKVKLSSQDLSSETMAESERVLASLEEKQQALQAQGVKIQEEFKEAGQMIEAYNREMQALALHLKDLETALKAFEELCGDYAEYVKRKDAISRDLSEKARLENQYDKEQKQEQLLSEKSSRLTDTIYNLKNTLHDLRLKMQNYQGYTKEEKDVPYTSVEEMETRFLALDQRLSHERKDLEERLAECLHRHEQETDNLTSLVTRYGLNEDDYVYVTYDREKTLHLTTQKKTLDRLLEDLRKRVAQEEKKTGRLEAKKETIVNTLREKWPGKTPLSEDEIKPQDYAQSRQRLRAQIKQEEETLKRLQRRYELMNRILTSLDVYQGEGATPYEEDLTLLADENLLSTSSMLKTTYEKAKEERNTKMTMFVRIFDDTRHNPAYRKDIFVRSLNAINKALDDAMNQNDYSLLTLAITQVVHSFHQYTEALVATMDMLAKQKKEHVDSLFNYAHMLYEEVDKIDSHSTITLGERSHKMLMIHLPKWDDVNQSGQESFNYTHIDDFYNDLCEGGVKAYQEELAGKNKSLHEYVRNRLTTANLFEHAVDLHDLTIKICKVTSASTSMQPIHWQEAITKFSDGETFLTSFIVLASLLYYMRYNDTDFFASKNDGKVLIMDNPFGKASAVHLLKPMMEIAKKNNIQLISLTAHDDETIRSCYDNIYVLKLQPSALQPDKKKLIASEEVHKGTHVIMEESHLTITNLIKNGANL